MINNAQQDTILLWTDDFRSERYSDKIEYKECIKISGLVRWWGEVGGDLGFVKDILVFCVLYMHKTDIKNNTI